MVVQSNCSLLHNTLLKTLTPPRQCLLFSDYEFNGVLCKYDYNILINDSFLIDCVKIKL